jgi:hypothetical protein
MTKILMTLLLSFSAVAATDLSFLYGNWSADCEYKKLMKNSTKETSSFSLIQHIPNAKMFFSVDDAPFQLSPKTGGQVINVIPSFDLGNMAFILLSGYFTDIDRGSKNSRIVTSGKKVANNKILESRPQVTSSFYTNYRIVYVNSNEIKYEVDNFDYGKNRIQFFVCKLTR